MGKKTPLKNQTTETLGKLGMLLLLDAFQQMNLVLERNHENLEFATVPIDVHPEHKIFFSWQAYPADIRVCTMHTSHLLNAPWTSADVSSAQGLHLLLVKQHYVAENAPKIFTTSYSCINPLTPLNKEF